MTLHSFIADHRAEIVARWRAKGAARSRSGARDAETEHGVPVFLEPLRNTLQARAGANPENTRSAVQHGHDLLAEGFSVSHVVYEYGDVCQSITELAVELNAPVSAADFGILNRCLDDAIAGAVTEYGRQRDRSQLDITSTRGSERLGSFARELQNLVSTAIASFGVLRTGSVGITGSTGSVLYRTLIGLRSVIDRSLAETRLTEGGQDSEPILVSAFVEDHSRRESRDSSLLRGWHGGGSPACAQPRCGRLVHGRPHALHADCAATESGRDVAAQKSVAATSERGRSTVNVQP